MKNVMKNTNRYRTKILATALAGGLTAGLLLTPGASAAHDGGCMKVKGKWKSVPVPVPPCTSAVGICTNGELHGTLKGGSYDFTMNTLTPTPEPTVPFVQFFTGDSTITLPSGHTLGGIDAGAMNALGPGLIGSGKFSTLLTFTAGGDGYLWIRGTLNFVTGEARGRYKGTICVAD